MTQPVCPECSHRDRKITGYVRTNERRSDKGLPPVNLDRIRDLKRDRAACEARGHNYGGPPRDPGPTIDPNLLNLGIVRDPSL